MMEYICHRRYKKKGFCEKKFLITPKTRLETIGEFIAYGPSAVCTVTSEDAHMYFARNDDGKGLERGKLTWAIAYKDRHPNKDDGYRFTPEEIEMLETEYPHFLMGLEVILFNHEFFNAEVEELRELYNRLEGEK